MEVEVVAKTIQNKINQQIEMPAENRNDFKYMRFMSLVYLTLLLSSTVCAYKIVQISFVPEPGSTLIYTFSFFWSNIFAEVYGSNRAKKLIWESIICGYIFATLITLVNWLPSPSYWDTHHAYNTVLGHVFRFTTAGTIGYLCSAFLNVYLLTKWKLKMSGRLFWLRSFFASTISEFAATFIAGILTFFGMMPTSKILLIMASAFIFKVIYGLIAVWPASFMAFLLKKKEGMVFDDTSLNPLKFGDKEWRVNQSLK